jgi:hypothetical protein
VANHFFVLNSFQTFDIRPGTEMKYRYLATENRDTRDKSEGEEKRGRY